MPKPYPKEFRDDVVRVARNRDDGVTLEQVAADFGVHPMTLSKWMRQADVVDDDGNKPGTTRSESAELRDAYRDDPEFGYRFLADKARSDGEAMAERTALRICSANRWWSAFGKRGCGKNGKPGPPVHDDLVRRNFTADALNRLWLSDITEHWTDEGKLYLCAVKDVFSNRIIGYSIDSRMKSRLAVTAVNNAVARRGDVAGCILHTDRGSQFRSRRFVHTLNRDRMAGSMGRVGAAGDNAAMESFFSLLQRNVLDRRCWETREQLRIAIVTWIERAYRRRR